MTASRFKRWVASWFIGAVALLFLIEEWLWNRLKQVMALLGRLPGLRRVDRWISSLSPAWAAVVFLAPSTLILPIKLFAVKMIATGHFLGGAGVILAAKIAATALFARVFVLTRPALMRVGWFVRLHAAVLCWRVLVHRQVEGHPLWRAMRRQVFQLRAGMAARSKRNNPRTRPRTAAR